MLEVPEVSVDMMIEVVVGLVGQGCVVHVEVVILLRNVVEGSVQAVDLKISDACPSYRSLAFLEYLLNSHIHI